MKGRCPETRDSRRRRQPKGNGAPHRQALRAEVFIPSTGAKREGKALTPAPLSSGGSRGAPPPHRAARGGRTAPRARPPLRSAARRGPRSDRDRKEGPLPPTHRTAPPSSCRRLPRARALSPRPLPSRAAATRTRTRRPQNRAQTSPFPPPPSNRGRIPAARAYRPQAARRPRPLPPPHWSAAAARQRGPLSRLRRSPRLPPPPPPPLPPQSRLPSLRGSRRRRAVCSVFLSPGGKRQCRSSGFYTLQNTYSHHSGWQVFLCLFFSSKR